MVLKYAETPDAGEVGARKLVNRGGGAVFLHGREVLEHAVVDLLLRDDAGGVQALQRVGDDGGERRAVAQLHAGARRGGLRGGYPAAGRGRGRGRRGRGLGTCA